jgi:hypothetical protein
MIGFLLNAWRATKLAGSVGMTAAVDDIAFDGAGRKRVGKVFTDIAEKGPVQAAKEAATAYQDVKTDVQDKKRAVAEAAETAKGVVTGDPEALKRVGGGILDKAKAAKDAVLGDAADGGTNWWKWLFGAGGAGVATWFGLSKLFGDSKKDEKTKEDNGFGFGSLFKSALAILAVVTAWKYFDLSEKFGLSAKKSGDSPSAAVPLDKKLSFSTPSGEFVAPAAAEPTTPTTPTAKKFAAAGDPKTIAQAALDKAAGRPVKATVEGPVRTGQEIEHETPEVS